MSDRWTYPQPNNPNHYTECDRDRIRNLLLGHSVTKVDERTLEMDDGRRLIFRGNVGGCSCGAGDYDLTALNGTDNAIFAVDFDDHPGGDDYVDWNKPWNERDYDGHYRIFVLSFAAVEADRGTQLDDVVAHVKPNELLAEFTGSDGNGYYGTGYWIEVIEP